jgi:hypothetical protein
MTQIYQVTVVWQNRVRQEAILLTSSLKELDTFGWQRSRFPLPLVTGKQGKSVRAYLMRMNGRILHTSGSGHVRSHQFDIPSHTL